MRPELVCWRCRMPATLRITGECRCGHTTSAESCQAHRIGAGLWNCTVCDEPGPGHLCPVTLITSPLRLCGLCGREAEGQAEIGGVPYCDNREEATPNCPAIRSCYERAQILFSAGRLEDA